MSIVTRASSKDALTLYRKHHLYAVTLEALADGQYCLSKHLFQTVTPLVNKEIQWSATMTDINESIKYLIFIGMIEVREDNAIRINKLGKEALADCRFQQLASSTFFNYTSMKSNQLGILFGLISLVVAVAALIVSVIK